MDIKFVWLGIHDQHLWLYCKLHFANDAILVAQVSTCFQRCLFLRPLHHQSFLDCRCVVRGEISCGRQSWQRDMVVETKQKKGMFIGAGILIYYLQVRSRIAIVSCLMDTTKTLLIPSIISDRGRAALSQLFFLYFFCNGGAL